MTFDPPWEPKGRPTYLDISGLNTMLVAGVFKIVNVGWRAPRNQRRVVRVEGRQW